jgi:hypothetical protein
MKKEKKIKQLFNEGMTTLHGVFFVCWSVGTSVPILLRPRMARAWFEFFLFSSKNQSDRLSTHNELAVSTNELKKYKKVPREVLIKTIEG